MKADLRNVRQILESKLKEATPARGWRELIHIDRVADPADFTQQAAEREVLVRHLDSDSALARRLRAALERLDGGSYGECEECGEEIAPKRLKAMPWAELCIRCQEQADNCRLAA